MEVIDLLTSAPGYVAAQYMSAYKELAQKGENAYGDKLTDVTLSLDGNKLGVDVRCKKKLNRIMLTWQRDIVASDSVLCGDAFERNYGDLEWAKRDDCTLYPWYVVMRDQKKNKTACYGVMTGCNTFATWSVYLNCITLTLDLRNGNSGVILGNRTLHATDIVCTSNEGDETVYETVTRFCRTMCPRPILPKEPVYGMNTWYYAYRNISAESFKADVDLLSKTTEGLTNRPYAVLDDGWMDMCMDKYYKAKSKPWVPDQTRFADMSALPAYCASKDVKAGIWFRPLIATKATKNKLLIHRDNPCACALRVLDPSIEQNLQTVKDVITTLKGWGFGLIKHDFSTYDILGMFTYKSNYYKYANGLLPWHFADRSRTTAEIVLAFYKAIREAAGEDTLIIGCNTVSHLSAGIFELQRIGDDTSASDWQRTLAMGVNSLAFRMPQNKTFYAADADCAGYNGDTPWQKCREWLRLLAESGTPLFTSVDPKLVDAAIEADLKEAYALASRQADICIPIGTLETKIPTRWQINGEEREFKLS